MAAIASISCPSSAFFDDVFDHYQRASQIGSTQKITIRIAGYNIQLVIVGNCLQQAILPALTHLQEKTLLKPDLTIFVWDSVSNKLPFIEFPWRPEAIEGRGLIKGFNNKKYAAAYEYGANGLNLLDVENNRGFFWVNNAEKLPYYEKGAPLRVILHWWLRTKHIFLTHAGAVGNEKGGVLLVGKGGSGKSTTSVACLNANLKYLSDDYCWTTPDNGGYAYSAFCTAKVDKPTLEKFAPLQRVFKGISPIEAEKNVYFLQEKYCKKIIRQFPIKAIFVPQVTHQLTSSLLPISSVRAIKALIPSSLFQIAGTGKKEFTQLAQLAKQVPCYQLNLGIDLEEIPVIISDFLEAA